ncbi:hypothetical protein V6N13_124377 [Hibiscus sabdariffa]
MLSKLPRDYYVHLYLEEVRPDQSIAANVEPEMNVEVRVESSEKPSDDAMKDGFKAGCRPIICFDKCHLKGHYGGQLLVAVGIDAGDCLYPIAFAIVEAKTESSWC